MKTMNKFNCLLAVFTLLSTVGQATLVRTINFDFRKGFTETLPFDESFMIHLVNKDTSIHCLKLIIKEFPNKHKYKQAVTSEAYCNSIPVYTEVAFQDGLEVCMCLPLRPNRYYLFELVSCERKPEPLSAKEQKDLLLELQNDSTLKKKIFFNLAVAYKGFEDVSFINSTIQAKVKNINQDYVVDTEQLATQQELFQTYNMAAHRALRNLGANIQSVIEEQEDETKKSTLLGLITYFQNGEGTTRIPIALLTRDANEYKTTLNTLISDAASSFKANTESNLDVAVSAINDWLKSYNEFLQETVSATYKMASLGNTIYNDDSFNEGNVNKFGTSVSQSVGVGYVAKSAKCVGYISYTIFFRTINNNVPFSAIPTWEGTIRAMLGINFGFTLSDMTTNGYGKAEGALSSALGDKAIFVGLCIRPMPWFKIDFNGLMYRITDPNPLNEHKRFVVSPLVGVSINFNLFKLIKSQPNSFTTIAP